MLAYNSTGQLDKKYLCGLESSDGGKIRIFKEKLTGFANGMEDEGIRGMKDSIKF